MNDNDDTSSKATGSRDEDATVTMKEAAFMLDTDMEQDMQTYVQENTLHAIKYINKTPKLYEIVKNDKDAPENIARTAHKWAEEHNYEFCDLFIKELESVDWTEVARKI